MSCLYKIIYLYAAFHEHRTQKLASSLQGDVKLIEASSMAAPVGSSVIVNELLDKHNYEDWSVRVKTYLEAKGLWNVIDEASDVPPKRKDKREAWFKGNAETLHAIHLCCGNKAFKVIRDEDLAHKAWDALRRWSRSAGIELESESESEPEPEPESKPESESGIEETTVLVEDDDETHNDSEKEEIEGEPQTIDHDAHQLEEVAEADDKADEVETVDEGNEDDKSSGEESEDSIPEVDREELFRNAKHSKWTYVMEFLKKHPTAVLKAAQNDDEKTLLHYAVEDMRVDIVKQLVPLIKDEDDLDMWDSKCFTALEYCYMLPDKDETVEIAKCLVQRKKELSAGGSDIDYPALLLEAFMKGRPKLTDYLFKLTQFENEDQYAPQFISLSFSTKRFDIACKLISERPELGIAEDFSGNSPLNELACTPSAFLSGSRLKFWVKWIYHVISIESSVKGHETKHGKGKATAKLLAVSGEVQPEEDGKGRLSNAAHTIVELPGFDVHKDKKDGHSHSGFSRNFCWCWNVPALFRGSMIQNLYKIFGIKHIYKMKVSHFRVHEILVCMCKVLTKEKMDEYNTKQTEFVEAAMFQAAERGLVEFLIEALKVNPLLSKITNNKGQSLFQVAVEYRQAEVFNLIHGFNKDNIKACMSRIDDDENNMFHTMGILSPSSETYRIRGAALQMQNELEWFEVLWLMANPVDLEAENDLDMIPREYFYQSHAEMKKEGEKSMKDTATSCTVVGALMVTMMFAVAFTLPAPLQENSTLPPLLYRSAFRVFIIADAISLFSSTTSVVLFMGILTARYAFDDFRTNLPQKMVLGLVTLFISVAAMVIVFASALFIILPADTRIALPVTLVAAIPVVSFLWMQLPFVVDIFHSTYMRRLISRKVHVKLNIGKLY